MQKRRWMVMLAVSASVLVFAACGGGAKKDKTPASAAGNATTASGSGDATKTSGKTVEATTSSDSGGSGGGSDDWNAMKQKFLKSTFHAEYTVTGAGAENFADGKLVMFKDGEKRFRFDVTAVQDGQEMALSVIEDGDVSAFCLKDAGELGALLGVEAGKGVCFKSNPDDPNNPAGGLSSIFSDIENDESTVLETSKKKVAGRDASCFKVKDGSNDEISTACFSKEGILLSMETEGADASTFEATNVEGKVSGGDFELPYEVRDMPGFGG
ncbi:MAG: hypothetical protein HY874_06460 [Chloroflexi bacterium]|nr:hypothetical protein [Chloroflexota bacterium]